MSNVYHRNFLPFFNEIQCCFIQFCMILLLVISTFFLLGKFYAKTFPKADLNLFDYSV